MSQHPPAMVQPGVFRLEIPLAGSPLKHLNAYLLTSDQGHLLIDTGWNTPDALAAMESQFAALDLALGDITAVVITHSHLDHFGLIRRLRRHCDARLYMGQVESGLIEPRFRQLEEHARLATEVLRRGGMPEELLPDMAELMQRFASLADVDDPDVTLVDGDCIQHGDFHLEVIWTPGHSPGHICLHEPRRRLLFSGDHILRHISPNVGVYPQSEDNPLGHYLESLDKVEGLEVDLVLPGHGRALTALAPRVAELREHHRERNQELVEQLRAAAGPQTSCQLAGGITWHSQGRPVRWQELPSFDQRLAIFEVMAHLEAMAEDGILVRGQRDAAIAYRLA